MVLEDPNDRVLVDVDYSHHWTSPIVWEASSTGNYHVSFEKTFDSLATYQLTVDPYDFTDDFGDVVEASSWIEPGTTIEGVLETPSDVDYFRFEATQGQSYSFATESGIATLRDADGVWLAGPSPVPSYYVRPQFIEWQANATDVYYLMVTGLRHGHRPLTFRVRFELSNYVDDRSDDIDGATEVELGQEVWGFAVGSHDFDYFRFSAESGRSYHIVVNDGPDRSIIDGGQYYEAQVYLLGPDGQLIPPFFLNDEGFLHAANSGEHHVVVSTYSQYGQAVYYVLICDQYCQAPVR